MIGHRTVGSGPIHAIVLNDWMSDCTSWDPALPYLDGARLTLALADLRGYGRSRGQTGAFDVSQSASDVLALADTIGWPRFAIVGHSMSSLVALHLAQHHADRVERAVLIAPPPPRSFAADDARLDQMRAIALGDDRLRSAALGTMWSGRLSPGWVAFKVARWRESADPEAAAAYTAMFARDGVPDPTKPVTVPLLAITGEHDAEVMRHDAVTGLLTPLCAGALTVEALPDSGHYPMQEQPPKLIAVLERFLAPCL